MIKFFERRKAAYQAFVEKQTGRSRPSARCRGFSKEERLQTRLLLKNRSRAVRETIGPMLRSFERRKAAYQAFVAKQRDFLRSSGPVREFFERRKAAYQAFVEKLR